MSDTTTATQDLLQDRITVEVRGSKYHFKIPAITHDLEVGYRAANIRRLADQSGRGMLDALDFTASRFAHCAAVVELYLTEAEEMWPFSKGPDGKPSIDHKKWPLDRLDTIYELGEAFLAEFVRFRNPRLANKNSAGKETVVGVEDHGGSGQSVG